MFEKEMSNIFAIKQKIQIIFLLRSNFVRSNLLARVFSPRTFVLHGIRRKADNGCWLFGEGKGHIHAERA